MNGIHDLGGMEGFGPINPPADEPTFHEKWEGSVFATVVGCLAQGVFTIDEFRHAVERMGNVHYLQTSYYEHWLAALQTLLTEKGLLDAGQIQQLSTQIRADGEPYAPRPPIGDEQLAPALAQGIAAGAPSGRNVAAKPLFSPGDSIRTKNLNPPHHTRLPAYARGKLGRIRTHYGAHILPDANAHGLGESPEYLYSVRFEASELWGADSGREASASYIDLWESYLEKDES